MAEELFEMLQEDHDRIKGLLDDLSDISDRGKKSREQSFRRLRDQLIPHLRAEEQVLYPVLERNAETREVALAALEEHHVAELVLSELSALPLADEHWAAKLKVLEELVEHHIEEEESDVFDAAEDVFDETQLEDFARQIRAVKQEVKAGVL
jgi:hemerythrin-like domain-containing protein